MNTKDTTQFLKVSKDKIEALETTRNETSMAVGELEAILELGYQAALDEGGGFAKEIELISYLATLKRITAGINNHMSEMEDEIMKIEGIR
jgi:hypothetical protein